MAEILGEASAALRRGDLDTARAHLNELAVGRNLARTLLVARNAIEHSVTALPHSRLLRDREATPRQPAASDHSILSIYAKEKLDSANAAHAELLDVLGQFLGCTGWKQTSSWTHSRD